MITVDNERTVKMIALKLGITHIIAQGITTRESKSNRQTQVSRRKNISNGEMGSMMLSTSKGRFRHCYWFRY